MTETEYVKTVFPYLTDEKIEMIFKWVCDAYAAGEGGYSYIIAEQE